MPEIEVDSHMQGIIKTKNVKNEKDLRKIEPK